MFECSCKNCYGLKELYEFLTVPFLKLQERALQERLQSVMAEANAVQSHMAELRARQDYAGFVAELSAANEKAKAAAARPAPSGPSPRGNPKVKTFTLEEPSDEPEEPTAVSEPAAPPAAPEPASEPVGPEEKRAQAHAAVGALKQALEDESAVKEEKEDSESESESDSEEEAVKKDETKDEKQAGKDVDTSVLDDFDTGEIDDGFWD